MESKGFAVTNGLFECLEESGGAGAGNPQSNTCFVMFNQSNNLLNDKAKYILQLEDRDAVLYLGCNPNAVHAPLYYGWSPYLIGFDIFHGLKGLPGGQLGDSLNQLTLNSTLRSSKTLPFGGTSVVIVTADETSASNIIDALPKLYRERGAINVLTVPSAELNVELGRGIFRNFFAFGCRAGPFPNKQARNQHATQALEQVLFFSQRLSRARAPPRPLVTPPRRSKAMPKGQPTEREMLNTSLAALISNIETFAANKGLSVLFKQSLVPQLRDGVPSNGTECVTNRSTTGCALDTDDAAYFDSPRLAALLPGEIDVIVGANSQATDFAVYSSGAVYTFPAGGGQGSVLSGSALDSVQYAGSAERFGGSAKLFALTASVTCGSTERWCLNATANASRNEELVYVTRAYLNPSTKTGPEIGSLLPGVVLRLVPSEQHWEYR